MFECNVRISYVEFGSTGHRPVWIKSVAEAFEREKLGREARLNIWVSQDFLYYHREWCSPYLKSSRHPNITLEFHNNLPEPSDCNGRRHRNLLNYIRGCVESDQSQVCFVANNLDALLRDLALAPPGSLGARLVGVMDQPYLHYLKFASSRTRKWLKPLKWLSQYVKSFLACHRSWVSEVLMLDPLAPSFYNAALGSGKFRFLPEYVLPNQPALLTNSDWALPEDRQVLLFIGHIDARKGLREFLEALEFALNNSPGFKDKATVMIAGPMMPEIRVLVAEKFHRLSKLHPNFPMRLHDRHITDQEFVSLISLADVVCLPYKYFVGTSGILTLAAALGRPVVASNFGLIGELVQRHELGLICNESDPRELALTLGQALTAARHLTEPRRELMRQWANLNAVSLEEFGSAVLAALIRACHCKRKIF